MRARPLSIAALGFLALGLGACNTPGDRALGGAAIGGLAGAGIGGLAGGGRGALIGGLAGAGVGAVAGATTAPVRPAYGPYPYYEAYPAPGPRIPVVREWREQPDFGYVAPRPGYAPAYDVRYGYGY